MSRTALAAAVALILTAELPVAAQGEPKPSVPGIDTHLHLDGVMSTGNAADAEREASASLSRLIQLMDRHGVERAIVMPPPQGPGQEPSCDYREVRAAIGEEGDRVAFAGGGGTLSPTILGTDPEGVNAAVRRRFEEEAERIVEAGAVAFGEMTALHLCLNPRHHFWAAAPDHPLFLLLADVAARHDLPIDLHLEALARDRETPASLQSRCAKNPLQLEATIPALERLLDHNERARIVWQHVGWDNTGELTAELLSRLLAAHGNLYIAVKAVPSRGKPAPNGLASEGGAMREEWIELIRAFPDRFVVGSDEFVRGDEVSGGYRKPPFFEETWRLMQELPDEVQQKVFRDNALAIYRF